jgi:hypothetical protein
MATGAEAVEAIAAAAGPAFPVGKVAGLARALKEARQDLWPLAGKGGGKSGAHVRPRHLTNLIAALASPQPIVAPEAVKTIRPLRYAARVVVYLDRRPSDNPHPQLVAQVQDQRAPTGEGFGEALERMIAESGDPASRAMWAMQRTNMEFSMCVSPALAEISWPTSDGIWTDRFQPQERELPFTYTSLPKPKLPGRQVSILPYEVIIAAGGLWEDTLARGDVDPARTAPAT